MYHTARSFAGMGRVVACRNITPVVVVCAFALVGPGWARAQPAPPARLTLQAATDRALSANPAIIAARLAKAVNVAGLDVAAERLNPEATVELEKETPKQSFGVAFPLELGDKRSRRIALSEATLRAGDAELAATTAQVRNDVRRTYFEVLVATSRLTVLRELSDLSQRARDAAQARFESGDAPRLEVVQADLALNAAQIDATSVEGEVKASAAKLNALLALPLDTSHELSTAIDAGGPVVTIAVLELGRRESVELAVVDRRIEQQRAKLALAHALRAPDVVPSATFTHDAEPEFTYGWRAGVAITLPLFTTHKAGVTLEEAALEQLIAEREAARRRIEGDITAAAAMAETDRLAYARYRDVILPQAQELAQLAEDSYRLGQTGIAVLLQALQAARDVRLRSLETVSRYQTALADLERAIGAPLP